MNSAIEAAGDAEKLIAPRYPLPGPGGRLPTVRLRRHYQMRSGCSPYTISAPPGLELGRTSHRDRRAPFCTIWSVVFSTSIRSAVLGPGSSGRRSPAALAGGDGRSPPLSWEGREWSRKGDGSADRKGGAQVRRWRDDCQPAPFRDRRYHPLAMRNFRCSATLNAGDRNKVQAALPDSLSGLMDSLPVLRTGEAIITGEAAELPIRCRITLPPENAKPSSEDPEISLAWARRKLKRTT